MKTPESSRAGGERFHAPIRHYHRINTQDKMPWDEWIHGPSGNHLFSSKNIKKWLKIAAVLVALLVLAAIIVGLFIELS